MNIDDVITEEYDSNQRQVNDLIASLRLELLTSRSVYRFILFKLIAFSHFN